MNGNRGTEKNDEKIKICESILTEIIDCGYGDLKCIYEMEKNHKGTIERAIELKDELGTGTINFGTFVMAVKEISIDEIEEEFMELFEDKNQGEEHIDSFRDMVIDDNYVAWGGIASYGYYEGTDVFNEDLQELFGEYVRGFIDKKTFLKKCKEVIEGDNE